MLDSLSRGGGKSRINLRRSIPWQAPGLHLPELGFFHLGYRGLQDPQSVNLLVERFRVHLLILVREFDTSHLVFRRYIAHHLALPVQLLQRKQC